MEVLELLIATMKSGVSFMISTIQGSKDGAGYALFFMILMGAGSSIFYYIFDLIYKVIKLFFQLLGNIFSQFFNLFQRKTKIERVEIPKIIEIKVIDEKGKKVKHDILEGL